MSIEKWSEHIWVGYMQDDPTFSDEMNSLEDDLEKAHNVDVVLDFAEVNYLNSSNIAKLLKLRKSLQSRKKRLILSSIDTNVWSVFIVTGLDKVFEVMDNLATALASIQVESPDI